MNWSLIRHFQKHEFKCKCGKHNEKNTALPLYAEQNYFYMCRYFLDPLRKDCASKININSAYRCPVHNREEGGSALSYHTIIKPLENLEDDTRPSGLDIWCSGLGWERFDEKIQKHTDIGYCGYNIYTKVINGKPTYFIHIDFRGNKARW